jgi:uncharacterized membrane protein YfcA
LGLTEYISLIVVGFAAGTLGGLLGIGGSIVMIPVLTLLFHHDQHVSQAAAMIVNVFVATPALLRHRRAEAVDWVVVRRMIPAGTVLILVGVELSNLLDGERLQRVFGVFLIYVVYVNVRRLLDPTVHANGDNGHRTWLRCSFAGGVTGFAAGLLGIGGGILTVPLLQRVCHIPLRHCIASSSAIMCMTAIVGATRKNLSLGSLGDNLGMTLDPADSIFIAACLAPTATLGGLIGAGFTHTMPLRWLRLIFILLLCVASAKLLGLF